MVYAKSLLPQIPEDSLTVFDKGFLPAEILCGLTMGARNRHFLIPAKSNTCWDVISGTADDATVRVRVSPQARKKCAALPESWGCARDPGPPCAARRNVSGNSVHVSAF